MRRGPGEGGAAGWWGGKVEMTLRRSVLLWDSHPCGEGRRFPSRISEENLQRMCANQVQAFLKLVSLITQFSCHR